MAIFQFVRQFIKRKWIFILFLLNGFLLASLLYFYTEAKYEDLLFDAIAQKVSENLPVSNPAREDSILIRSLHTVHYLVERRLSVFQNSDISGWKADVLRPLTFDLMTGQGACGSNSYILGRLLQEFGFEIRFPQMKVNGIYGGHILIEVKTIGGWGILDPSYDLAFNRPNGKLASFKDIQSNWDYYKKQVPYGYDMNYKYDDVQYTNWDKIPVLMPLLKHTLYFIKGKETTDSYSLRSLVLRKYAIVFNILLLIYIFLSIYMVKKYGIKKIQHLRFKLQGHTEFSRP